MIDSISLLDWVVFYVILLATFITVLIGYKRKKKANLSEEESFLDLLILGRQLTLPLFIATLVATWYGGIFGVTRIAFEKGIFNFFTQGFFWYISYIIFALFIVKRIKKYQAVTLPDLINKMFGPKSSKIAAIFNLFNVIPIVYVISLGIFIQYILGTNLVVSMIIGLIFVQLYSLLGGLRAVIYSDLIQFFVMCFAVILVAGFSLFHYGGLTFLKANLPATHFDPTGGESIWTLIVWGFIALSTLIDPNFYQRVFAARSTLVAKKGILISIIIWIIFDICTTMGGMYARAVIPDADPNQAYLVYALQLLPNGLRGVLLAGILATILSTLDSYLFLSGATISNDLLKGHKKIRNFHLSTFIVSIITVIVAYGFDGNIRLVWKVLGSYSASCMLLPVLINYKYPKLINDNQFSVASLTGVIATTSWLIWGDPRIEILYIGMSATFCSLFLSRFLLK